MSSVGGIGDAYYWSVFRITKVFGPHRDAVKRRLLAVSTPVAVIVGENPVYTLQHVGPVLSSMEHGAANSTYDPPRTEPKKGRDWYQPENERIRLEKGRRKFISVDEVVIVYPSMRKAVVQVLETTPDVLERDYALTPQAISAVQRAVGDLRYTLQERSYKAYAAKLIPDEEGGSFQEE